MAFAVRIAPNKIRQLNQTLKPLFASSSVCNSLNQLPFHIFLHFLVNLLYSFDPLAIHAQAHDLFASKAVRSNQAELEFTG